MMMKCWIILFMLFIYIDHHARLNVTASLPFESLNMIVFAAESYMYFVAEFRESM